MAAAVTMQHDLTAHQGQMVTLLGALTHSTSKRSSSPTLQFIDASPAEALDAARELSVPAYAIDDDTAITVVDAAVEVVSEGKWKLLTPARRQASRLRRRASLAWASSGYDG